MFLTWEDLTPIVAASSLSIGDRAWIKRSCAPSAGAGVGAGHPASGSGVRGKARVEKLSERQLALRRARARRKEPAQLLQVALDVDTSSDEDETWPWAGTSRSARAGPAFWTAVYTGGRTAKDFAEDVIARHNIRGSHEADSMLLAAKVADVLFLNDGLNLTRSAGGEVLARRLQAEEDALAEVTCNDDLRKGAKDMQVFHATDLVNFRGDRSGAVDAQTQKELANQHQRSKYRSNRATKK